MGHTKKCTYRLDMTYVDFTAACRRITSIGLMSKDIKPTVKSVVAYRDAMNASIMNGSNTHLQKTQSLYSNAQLVDQRTGQILVAYIAPKFELI